MQNAKMTVKRTVTQFQLTSDLLRSLYKFKLTPVTKLVLLELTTHLNENRNGSVVFPSVNYIAEVLGIGLTATKKAINDLISEGFIIKTKRDKIRGNYNKYLLTPKVQISTSEPSQNECFKKSDNDLFITTDKKEPNKTTNVVVLNQIPDLIRNNANIKNKCAYWASLSDEVKQEYIQKDLQLKEKDRKQQAALERIRQRELQAEKERQDLIAECSKPLSVQYDYETAFKIVKRLAKFDKSCLNKPFPQELIKTFNIKL